MFSTPITIPMKNVLRMQFVARRTKKAEEAKPQSLKKPDGMANLGVHPRRGGGVQEAGAVGGDFGLLGQPPGRGFIRHPRAITTCNK